jgi:hypothetical protein
MNRMQRPHHFHDHPGDDIDEDIENDEVWTMARNRDDLDQQVEGPFSDEYKCKVCYRLIVDPRECPTCNTLICNSCAIQA